VAGAGTGAQFPVTRWSVVLAAGRADAQEALADLCGTYWGPVYAFVRRAGFGPHEAQDLTQSFFARVLEKNFIQKANPQKGKFRSFLLHALRDFLANYRAGHRAAKRGGEFAFVSLEAARAEHRYGLELVDELTADKVLQRQWAWTLLERATELLCKEYAAADKADLFEALEVYLSGEKGLAPYAQMAARLAMTEGAVKVAVHRLRRRFGEMLRSEIAQTVCRPEDVDEEIRELFAVFKN
jgi:RNA polymerase sigma-70 factor (ECF subfamily)